MKPKAHEFISIWQQVQASYLVHMRLLDEAYLREKFVFKACLMTPKFYHDMMQDEQAKLCAMFQTPFNELKLFGIPVKITHEVDSISWIVDLND